MTRIGFLAVVFLVTVGVGGKVMAQGTNGPAPQNKPLDPVIQAWAERITVGGELRLRHQTQTEEGLPQRTRERFRARFNVEGVVNDQVKAVVRLVTNAGGDPISDNQTMTGSWSDKTFAIDRAFLNVTPADGVNVYGGKVAQPWFCAGDLVFSEDINPEGLALNYKMSGKAATLFAHGGYWVLEERSKDDDTTMVSGQVGMTVKANDAFKVTLGASVYSYGGVQGRPLFFNTADGAGNSTTTNKVSDTVTELRYAEGYNEIEGFVRAEMDMRVPVTISGQYVVNTKPEDDNKAYMAAITLGKVKKPGSLEVGCQYRYLEKDAVLGVFAENGETGRGTDAKALAPFVKYRLWKDFDVKALYSKATKGLDDGHDFEVFRVDVSVKF